MKDNKLWPGRYHSVGFLLQKMGLILVGTFLYAAGIALFLDPNELAPGGVVGLAVIASHTIGGTTGNWYFLLNIPIVILGWKKFGGKFIALSFYAICLNSLFTNMFSIFPTITDNLLLASIAGSLLVGTGIGLVLRAGSTTGGMDIVIKVLRKRWPSLKTSTLFLVIDLAIVTLAGFIFRDFNIAMYAFITVALNGRVLDYILYGGDEAKLIYIISDQTNQIRRRLLAELEIGASILQGQGAYSGAPKEIIMCVVRKRNAPYVEEVVKQEDNQAFMIITRANEIYGEGYKDMMKERI
ncbi:MAG: YitT family protein [Eubacteriales bacterium]|nr:YitT family protein [Eubacteriales bacterium]